MPRPPAQPHYLRRNEKVWTPPAIILLDTETRTLKSIGQEVLTLRLWAARFIDRKPRSAAKPIRFDAHGTTVPELVEWIESMMIGHRTVWLFAHNLSFDLTTTRLPLALADSGWHVSDAAIGGKAPWIRMGTGTKVLTMVDSGSWFPAPLNDVGAALGMVKPALPGERASRRAWLHRCQADVDILSTAVTQLLDWWDKNELGRFNLTGPSSGWNAFRHIWTGERIVMDPEPEKVAHDRLAVHGGRRGVWRVGRVSSGPLLELDIASAYPGVAAALPLPTRRTVSFDTLPIDDRRLFSERWGVLAEVELETDVPRWPVKWRKATWYPTGRFRTVLAGPEIAEAARLGCLRWVGPGTVHQLGHVLMPWAQWVLGVQGDTSGEHPPAARIAAKHWGRAVIGKFCARGFEKEEMGGSPVLGWGYTECWDHNAGVAAGFVDLAGSRWWVTQTGPADNAYPAVTAWVESHVRLRLSRVLAELGDLVVVQCDTDGLIVSGSALARWCAGQLGSQADAMTEDELVAAAIGLLNELTAPLRVRIKRSYEQAMVLGPQHIEIPGERRFSGLPRDARQIGPNKYAAHTWPKLQWQLSHGDHRGYVRPMIEPTIKGPFANGWVTTSGRVIPPMATVTREGATELLPWEFMPDRIKQQTLMPEQHAGLKSLMR